ncbi:MAG TPA: thiamine biosynthesis protein ThiS [Rheinheimera sp.]|uniref:sulfur carrier protein ThiS n=1 Tax=Rheinheimera sp. TaxID=1869214 RepID=UPI000EBCB37C|nr:sulfur carrier protein ThiS [Rheinheimera sp.]HCU66048.1 thiamine biosynthesis protein ThiS [Rheinheimera sp.]
MHGHQIIELTVNQQPFVIEAKATVAALLTAWSGEPDGQLKVAVALNQQVLPRKKWSTQQLQHQDELLIFNLVAGG